MAIPRGKHTRPEINGVLKDAPRKKIPYDPLPPAIIYLGATRIDETGFTLVRLF